MPNEPLPPVKDTTLISKSLQYCCKRLLKADEKEEIADKTNLSVAMVNYVIDRTRYNAKVEEELKKSCDKVLKELHKRLYPGI